MVNRTAKQHLALIASILLCFFVYMGYRYRGQAETSSGTDGSFSAPAREGVGTAGQPSSSLITLGDPVAPEAAAVRVPIATPSGLPAAPGGGDVIPDIASLVQLPQESVSPLRPPGAGTTSPPTAPSGSIEESLLPGLPEEGEMEILGLTPDTPSPAGDAGVSGISLELPPLDGGGVPTETAASASPAPQPAAAGNAAQLAPPPISSPLQPTQDRPPARQPDPVGAAPAAPAPRQSNRPPEQAPLRPTTSSDAPRDTQPPPQSTAAPTNPPPAARPPQAVLPRGDAETRIYVVRPGDTLSRIATRELGSSSLADNIFLMNTDVISDPNHLEVGMRILLPPRKPPEDAIVGVPSQRPGPGSTPAASPPSPYGPVRQAGRQARVHVVGRGDTLSSIALRYYGSSSAWRFLYEANTNTISNPNRLKVGTQLIIPPYGEMP